MKKNRQGISNRPDDEAIDTTNSQGLAGDEDAEVEGTEEEYEDDDGFEEDDEPPVRPA